MSYCTTGTDSFTSNMRESLREKHTIKIKMPKHEFLNSWGFKPEDMYLIPCTHSDMMNTFLPE